MRTIVVDAATERDAIEKCSNEHGWTPDAVREVDSGGEYIRGTKKRARAWMCFESAVDADTWDKQK